MILTGRLDSTRGEHPFGSESESNSLLILLSVCSGP